MRLEQAAALRNGWGDKPRYHPFFVFTRSDEKGNTCGRSLNRAYADALVADCVNRGGDGTAR